MLVILFLTLWLAGAAHAQERMTGPGAGSCGEFAKSSEQTDIRYCSWAQGFMAARNAAMFKAKRTSTVQASTRLFPQRRPLVRQQRRYAVGGKPQRRTIWSSKEVDAMFRGNFILIVVFSDFWIELPLGKFRDLASCVVAAIDHDFKNAVQGLPRHGARAVCWEMNRNGHVVEIHVPRVPGGEFVAASSFTKSPARVATSTKSVSLHNGGSSNHMSAE
jgi:hypothetical protein